MLAISTLSVSLPADRVPDLVLGRTQARSGNAWTRFLQRMPRPVFLDRVLWLGVAETDRRRLPAVRLRRIIDATRDATLEAALRTHWPTLGGIKAADVRRIAAQVLGPFEDTVAAQMDWTHDDWARADVIDQGLQLTAMLPTLAGGQPGVVYRAAMWRVAVAYWLTGLPDANPSDHRALLRHVPHSLPESEYPIHYLGTLFADTHLDLRALALSHGRADDVFFLGGDVTEPQLTNVYPLPHRVVCADELPDFVRLVTAAELDFDTGWPKRLYNMDMLLAYLFVRKATNSICHVRSISTQFANHMKKHPALVAITQLVIQCVLLGNMRHCARRMGDATRVRVRLAFGPGTAGAGVAGPTLDELSHWMKAYPELILLMMRDHLVGIIGAQGGDPRFHETPFADFASAELAFRTKWKRFAQAVDTTMSLVRLAFHRQTLAAIDNPWAPFDWPAARTALPEIDEAIDAGISLARSSCFKTHKGRAEEIIGKNMTSVEPNVLAHHVKKLPIWPQVAACIARIDGPAVFAFLPPELGAELMEFWPEYGDADEHQRQIMLEALIIVGLARVHLLPQVKDQLLEQRDLFHQCAAAAAADERRRHVLGARPNEPVALVLRFMRLLMTARAHHEQVQAWFMGYYTRTIADNRFKARALELGRNSLADYVAVRVYMRLVPVYRNRDRMMLLPADQWLRENTAVRDRLQLTPLQASHPDAHLARFCAGCDRWVSYVQKTPRWIDPRQWDTKKNKKGAAAAAATAAPTATVKAPDDMIGPIIRPMLLPGASGHCLGAVAGECYCPRGKAERQSAQRVRQTADTMRTLIGDDEQGLLPKDGDAPVAAGDNASDDDEEEEEEDDDLLAGLDNASDGEEDDDEEDDGPRRRRKESSQKLQQQKKVVRRACGRAYAVMMEHALEASRARRREICSLTPLLAVDMLGLWYLCGKGTYGRCQWCGDLVEVNQNTVTTYGLSCMYHPHPGEFADDHLHTLLFDRASLAGTAARAPKGNGSKAAQQLRQANAHLVESRNRHVRHPHLVPGTEPVPCAFCGRADARVLIRIFDDAYGLFEVPVCPLELQALSKEIGASFRWGAANVHALSPLSIKTVEEHVRRKYDVVARERQVAAAEARMAAHLARMPTGEHANQASTWVTLIMQHPGFTVYAEQSKTGRSDALTVATLKMQSMQGRPSTPRDLAMLRAIWIRLGEAQ